MIYISKKVEIISHTIKGAPLELLLGNVWLPHSLSVHLVWWGGGHGTLLLFLYSIFCLFSWILHFTFMPCVQEGGEEDPVLSQWWPVLQVLISFENLAWWIIFSRKKIDLLSLGFIFALQLRGDHGLGGRGVRRQVAVLLAHCCSTSQKYGQYRQSMWRPNEHKLAFSKHW